MNLLLPELSLVVLIGPSGSGKSSFARRHFLSSEVISSDQCRGMVSDDENDQAVTGEAFELLNFIVRKRLALGRLTVIDATNVDKSDRARLVALAREFHVLPSAIIFKTPEGVCQERNRSRPDRDFGPHVIKRQGAMMRRGLKGLKREGFRSIHTFNSVEEIEAVTGIERQPMWNNKRNEPGPFDIVGDVHGCFEELRSLLLELGYAIEENTATHQEGRRLIFVGDLVDRGPDSPNVLRLVMDSVAAGTAFCVPGNHDAKLLRHLNGRKVQLTHGLDGTVSQLEADPVDHRDLQNFLDSLVSHYIFDDGRLVVAHAGLKEEMQGRGSGRVREFCLYGETTGERDEFGLPERLDWAANYRGKALVVHGHTPFAEPRWLNNTVNIDTGCAFGGRLTALRYPEFETVSVPALQPYAEAARPLREERLTNAQQDHDRLLDLADVCGKRMIHTRLIPNLSVREENSMAALEVMSRFAVDPRWLIYLPPTMSPSATSEQDGWLERPEEGFAYFRSEGVGSVICEEKHMGSRAVVVVCRDPSVAVTRFGLPVEERGSCFTRTGRPFFNDSTLTSGLLERLAAAVEKAGLWEELETDWLCLDCELMPWSVKARELLEAQYSAVGAAGEAHVRAALQHASSPARNHGLLPEAEEELSQLATRLETRGNSIASYRKAYGHYCWEVVGLDDLKLAPFHILAGEERLLTSETHDWHMNAAERLAAADPILFQPTRWREVSLTDDASEQDAVRWWEELTSAGGEGMVIKPRDFVTKGRKGVVQPAVKCRGREYLRIIYGPEYDLPEHLGRLRQRGLGHKRSMARREFALGLEALERFIKRRPLREVHECVFAVLAMESEPVDPRL